MAVQLLSTIKEWFRTAKKPTQAQFWDTWDSFWHKQEKIPVSAVDNLQTILNNKAELSQLAGKANQTALDAETTARQDGDTGLQEQISNLQKITAIRGNVDTHADLLAIDTANMRSGDSYIVEADETHDNKATIYAFDAENSAWIYTGEWSTAADLSEYQKIDEKGTPNGYAPLGADNKVPSVHLHEMGGDTNIGNSDIFQTDQYRRWNLNGGMLYIDGNGEVFAQCGSVAIVSWNYKLECDQISLYGSLRIGTKGGGESQVYFENVQDAFLWVNHEGQVEFLKAEEFKAKLGL